MLRETLAKLASGATIITANRRISGWLQTQYDFNQHQLGHSSWATPHILPLAVWLAQSWQVCNTAAHTLLLNDWQAYCLWEQIIRASKEELPLLQTNRCAILVQQAWNLIHTWDLPITTIDQYANENSTLFSQWAKQFKKRCQQQNWITQAEIPTQLCELAQKNRLNITHDIALIGFDELTPTINELFNLLSQNHIVSTILPSSNSSTVHRIHLADQDTEILTMARFAKQHLEENPSHKIACIVPNLDQLRDPVETQFNHVFSITPYCTNAQTKSRPFNFSAGKRLNQYNIIQIALNVLDLSLGNIEMSRIAAILQSPYLSMNQEDCYFGALCDARLREQEELKLPLTALLDTMAAILSRHPKTTWPNRWRLFMNACKPLKEHHSRLPSEWAEHFSILLHTLRWPGGRSLNSLEHQLMTRWKKLWHEFAALDHITNHIDLNQALRLIHRLAEQIIFQPKSSDAPIQILGLLEAGGTHFDAMWVMGLHNEAWPPKTKPNPFIPYALQKKYNMPHASASRELTYTQQTMQRLLNSADEIILSSPNQQADKRLQPSPLIEAHTEITLSDLRLTKYKDYATCIFKASKIEHIQDDQAPEIDDDELIQGGSWILKNQALCPFRSFASTRLNAQSLAEPSLGIKSNTRGILVHAVLEDLWLTLKDQPTLLAMTDLDLQQLIHQSIKNVIKHHSKKTDSKATRFFLNLEKNRLSQLMMAWLTLEKTRPTFKVLEVEQRHQIQLNRLNIHVRIDRVDQLSDGSVMIIDYKTNQNRIDGWFGIRPEDPQLPLYCVHRSQNDDEQGANAIAFAEVRTKHMTFRGLVSEHQSNTFDTMQDMASINEYSMESTPLNWQNMIKQWRDTLQQLSDDFCNGKAQVNPLDSKLTCQYCDLQPLCRIKR